jgi:hypothetical protein
MLSGPIPAVMSGLLPTAPRSSGLGVVFKAVGPVFGDLGPPINYLDDRSHR